MSSHNANSLLYELSGIGREYKGLGEKLVILKKVDFSLAAGDLAAILGASGSGKSTLLHIMGTLDQPSWGSLRFMGRDMLALSPSQRAAVRNHDIGFVFQFHHLLPEFNTVENVAIPGLIAGMSKEKSLGLAREALGMVGLAERLNHRVTTLSGGERQRAAIARAILMRPKLLLADEPTGNLDENTAEVIAQMLLRLNRELGMTMVVVTHNHSLAALMTRRLELRSGELYEQID